ncbi:hypothetical protein [Catellatospora sp. NPDC049609]|uniref:hypothetical protein n=1 Tax=Catellatospora sp. NPDC049609 TaxID=3155505 RepID=UPI003420126C
MSNEVRIPFTVTGEDQAARDIDKVGAAVERTGDAIDDMGGKAADAATASDKAGDSFRETAVEAGFLARQAAQAEQNVKRLVIELNRTGDTSLKKDIRKERRSRSEALALLKEITPTPTEVAKDVGPGFVEGLGMAVKAGGPYLKAAVAGLALLVAPALGATISAAVLGGVGAGGIVGGVALAARDPAVVQAGADLADAVSAGFSQAASPFVQPIVDGLDRLATTGTDAAEELKPGFDALAGTIRPLAEGIDGLAKNSIPGVTAAMKAAAPVVRLLANELPGLGEDLGDAFEVLAEDPDGAVMGLKSLLDVTGDTVKGIAVVVSWLSQAYEGMVKFGAGATGALEDLDRFLGWIPMVQILSDHWADANDKLEGQVEALEKAKVAGDGLAVTTTDVVYVTRGLGVSAEATAEALDAQRLATMALVDAELSSINAAIKAERAIDDLAEARKENGRSLDIEKEAGRRNTEAILEGIEAVKEGAQREYDLAMAHGATVVEAEKAAAAYRDKYGKELTAAVTKLYGNTKAVQDLLAELAKLDGKRITYTLVQRGGRTIGAKVDGGLQLAGDDGVYRRAGGGDVKQGRTYWVGENGPELVTFGANGWVHTAEQSRAMMSGASGGGVPDAYAAAVGGAGIAPARNITILVRADTADAVAALVELVRFEVTDVLEGEAAAISGGPRT